MATKQTPRPQLAVVRANPSKAWGSGITLDPTTPHPPVAPTEPSEAPVHRRWLDKMFAEQSEEWMAMRRQLLENDVRWRRHDLANAKGAVKRAKRPESIARAQKVLAEETQQLAAAELQVAAPTPRPELGRTLCANDANRPEEPWAARGWVNFDYRDGAATFALSLHSPEGQIASAMIAGAHTELAARLVRTIEDYRAECAERDGATPPLTVC